MPPDCPRSAREGTKRNRLVVGVQQPVKLSTTGFHALCEAGFRQRLLMHERVELPRDHTLDRPCSDLFIEAFLFEKIVKRRSNPALFLHLTSFLRFNANS